MNAENNNNGKVFRASVWNFVGTFLLKAIAFLSVPIFTRIMKQADYGLISTYNTYISFLGIVIGLSLNTATINARIDFSDRFRNYNANILRFSTVIFIIEVIIGNIIFPYICDFLAINRLLLNMFFVVSYSEYIVNTYYKINTTDFKFVNNLKISITNAIFSLFLSILLVETMENGIVAKLVGQSLFIFIAAIIIYHLIALREKVKFEFSDIKYAANIALPNIFHQISQMIMSQSDRVIILNFCGAITTAKYSAVYTFGLLMQMVWNAINEVWVPWLYRELYSENFEKIRKMSNIYLLIFTFISMMAVLVAPDLMFIIAPATYLDARDMVIPVLLGTYFMFVYSFFANIEIYNKKNKYIAIATAVAAIANIIGNYALIPLYGYKAAAYTTLMSYILLMLMHYILLTFRFKLNIYGIKIFIPYICLMFIISFFSLIFVERFVIRYFVLFLLVLLGIFGCYIKRNQLLDFVNSIRR